MIDLLKNEKKLHVIIKHPIIIFGQACLALGMAVAPLLLFRLGRSIAGFALTDMWLDVVTFLWLGWILFVWVAFFVFWTNYILDVWVVTTKRLIDIEQKTLFTRSTATVRLDDVEDITVDENGFWSALFGFATIKIQSAGTTPEFVIPFALNPQKAKQKIFEAQEQAHQEVKPVKIV